MKTPDAVTLLLSDARGIYIPRDFVTGFDLPAWGLTEDTRSWWECAEYPDNENYWDAWDWVLNNAKYTDEAGNVYYLSQDGDLWALCYERMTEEEKSNFGMED